VDTSAWVEALRRKGDSAARGAVERALADGTARVCDFVLVELQNSASGQAEGSVLRDLAQWVDKLPIDDEVWAYALELAEDCRAAGATVPAACLLIAACAHRHGASLLHCDDHFERIAGVRRRG
jgi:predicted nucleic acid-binding protein